MDARPYRQGGAEARVQTLDRWAALRASRRKARRPLPLKDIAFVRSLITTAATDASTSPRLHQRRIAPHLDDLPPLRQVQRRPAWFTGRSDSSASPHRAQRARVLGKAMMAAACARPTASSPCAPDRGGVI